MTTLNSGCKLVYKGVKMFNGDENDKEPPILNQVDTYTGAVFELEWVSNTTQKWIDVFDSLVDDIKSINPKANATFSLWITPKSKFQLWVFDRDTARALADMDGHKKEFEMEQWLY